jgi:outer membrane receptor protein involved in Fe transport
MKFSVDHSQLFYFKEEGFPGTGMKNKLGQKGRPPWRNTLTAAYSPTEHHEISASAMTIAGQEKEVATMGRIQQYTTYDLLYSYKSKRLGTVTAGVKNIFASTPPLDDSVPTAPLDVTMYDQIGRQLYTSYKATF